MEIFLTRLFSGFAAGSVYALIALTLVIVFRSSGTINFAQGEFALFTTYLAWWLNQLGLPLLAALPVVVLVGFGMGAATERFLISPISARSEMGVLIVSLGLFTALNGLSGLLWGSDDKPFRGVLPAGSFEIGGALLPFDVVGLMLVLVAVVVAVHLLLTRTPLGLSMRAVATNRESAALSGVDVGRVLMSGWGLAAAIGALAGVLLTPVLPPNQLSLATMFTVLIYGAAAALLGGLDSIRGAVVGGLALGVAQAMIGGYLGAVGAEMKLTIAFLIIVGILVVRPAGLFGTRGVVRV